MSEYKNFGAEGWESLVNARGDAQAVADVLEQKYGFNVTRLFDTDATRRNMIVALDQLTGAYR